MSPSRGSLQQEKHERSEIGPLEGGNYALPTYGSRRACSGRYRACPIFWPRNLCPGGYVDIQRRQDNPSGQGRGERGSDGWHPPDMPRLHLPLHGFIPLGGEWKFYDFPLEAKKTWRITPQGWFRGTPIKYTIDINVLAYEDVKTKAGTFKAFKIHRAWTVHGRSGDSRWTDETWFSPDVKFLVRFTTTSSAPGIQNFELVSYTVK